MSATDLKSGRWQGQLIPLTGGEEVEVTIAIDVAKDGSISGEYWAHNSAGEFHGNLSGKATGKNVQLSGADGLSNYDAVLHSFGDTDILTGFATFGGEGGVLTLKSMLQVESSAWDERASEEL